MPSNICAVPGCSWSHQTTKLSGEKRPLFSIQRPDLAKTAEEKEHRSYLTGFIISMQNASTLDKIKKKLKIGSVSICNSHFHPDDIKQAGPSLRHTLKLGAKPRFNLPKPVPQLAVRKPPVPRLDSDLHTKHGPLEALQKSADKLPDKIKATANGSVGMNHQVMPMHSNPTTMTGGGVGNMNGPRHNITRFNQPMANVVLSTGQVLDHNMVDGAPRSQNQAEYMPQIISKQSNEENLRMDDNSPLVNTNQASGMQNMSHLNQSNSGQDTNSLNNNLQNCFNQQTDIKPGTEATSIDSNLSGPRSTPGGLSDQMPHLVIDSMQHRNQIATVNHNPFLKPKSISLDTTVAQKGKVSQKVFDPLEFEQALIPVVKKLYKQEPEALPFRQPVDPEELKIPDYFDIVKHPMDLATISKNLETKKYKGPWEFIADIWQMFNNAWLYNKRTTRVYKYCTKLKEVFEAEIDPVMKSLGYCCGKKREFMPLPLFCYKEQLYTIPPGGVYYDFQNRYYFCEKCFNHIQGDLISLADDQAKPQTKFTTIPKSQFKKEKNDVLEQEPFEICSDCEKKMHTICELCMPPIWPERYSCKECLSKRGAQRKQNPYEAIKLPQNELSEHIEKRVNNYISRHDTTGEAGRVHIRVVYSGDKTVEVQPGMKSKFVNTGEMPETFPYRAKAFFAFEEIDGVDVCFFGVHVQEYGSDSPKPNQRRVYLSYLDSVHFFRPRPLRTAVYHEILLGYFEYCKNLGYEFAHIWACPPCIGDDYIFHCHSVKQKIPKPKQLQDWYKKMLVKAISEKVIVGYKDIFQAKEDRLQCACDLPYFEGDFWPDFFEKTIKEMELKKENRKQAEASEEAAAEESDRQTLNEKSNQIMKKHKEAFFVIRLNSVETINKMGPTVDPDIPMQCDLMDGRDAFLKLAQKEHYEFSSVRRTKYSTMAMLIELHKNGQVELLYMCNRCKNNVETRHQCTVCPVFDLCENCYKEIGHEHKMDKMGLGIDDGTAPEAAVRAAKQAQQLVDQQDTESKKYMLTSNRNQMSTRPMPSNPRQVGPTWGQIQRPPVQMKIAGKYQPLIGGVPQQSVATSSNQTLKLVVDLLKIEGRGAPGSSEQLMALLKTNPQLISTLIRQRKKAAHTQQPQQKPQQFIKQSGMTSLGNVTMAGGVGVQQVPMQSSNNQPGMNMPVQVNNMSNMQPIHWQQQQQQQQRRMQLPHQNQQGQFQTPAPPYPQATRMMNVRFMQHRMQTPVRHQMNPNLVMQQGMNPSMSNMQQGLQSPMQHHTQQRPSSQPMQAGRLSQMSPHAMAGRTPPLNQNQGTVPQHMISTMDQQYNTVNSQPTLMGGGYPHQGVGQTMNFNNQTGTGFATNVNQDLSHLGNAAPGQDNLERFVKISDK